MLQEASTAKYIVQQYTAATGGQPALNSVQSMCVTGHVRIRASDFQQGGGEDECVELKTSREEVGGFVLWQKNPDLWCLELLVPGCKVICGSNGKLSWRHSSNQQTPISNGPPRPLRRFLQVSFSLSLTQNLCTCFNLKPFLTSIIILTGRKHRKKNKGEGVDKT